MIGGRDATEQRLRGIARLCWPSITDCGILLVKQGTHLAYTLMINVGNRSGPRNEAGGSKAKEVNRTDYQQNCSKVGYNPNKQYTVTCTWKCCGQSGQSLDHASRFSCLGFTTSLSAPKSYKKTWPPCFTKLRTSILSCIATAKTVSLLTYHLTHSISLRAAKHLHQLGSWGRRSPSLKLSSHLRGD